MNFKLKILFTFIFSLILNSFSLQGQAIADENVGKELHVPVTHVFAPQGFDSNDNIQIVLSGYLPNFCYKTVRKKVKINQEKKEINIEVHSIYQQPRTGFCVEVIIPFLEVISLGSLNVGDYQITINENSDHFLSSSMNVTDSNSESIDDFTYANVEQIIKNPSDPYKIQLKGVNPTNCLVLSEIKIASNHVDTYAVLPIMKQVSNSCDNTPTPFSYDVQLPGELRTSPILIHVRSLGGKSVNTILGRLL